MSNSLVQLDSVTIDHCIYILLHSFVIVAACATSLAAPSMTLWQTSKACCTCASLCIVFTEASICGWLVFQFEFVSVHPAESGNFDGHGHHIMLASHILSFFWLPLSSSLRGLHQFLLQPVCLFAHLNMYSQQPAASQTPVHPYIHKDQVCTALITSSVLILPLRQVCCITDLAHNASSC